VSELELTSISDECVQHHLGHVEANLIEWSKVTNRSQIIRVDLVHRDWSIVIRLMRKQREEHLHGLILMDLVAVFAQQHIIATIVVLLVVEVLIFARLLVGIIQSLMAEAAQNAVVLLLQD